MQPILLFVPEKFLDLTKRGLLIPILRPFYKKESYTDEQRLIDYGLSNQDFHTTVNLSDANVIVLPMAWEYYKKSGVETELFEWIKQNSGGKLVWGWNSGDDGVDIPNLPVNVIIYRLNTYASKKRKNERSMPSFFNDPVKETPGWDQNFYNLNSKITVGFCGQAKGNIFKFTGDIIRTLYQNFLYKTFLAPYQSHAVFSSTRLRQNVLNKLENNEEITTDFIKRRKYRAGAYTPEDRTRSRREFVQNISNNDYTVCLRGGGNFSVRLFETMALGRIPIQVNTDCIYPLPELINWMDQTCYIERQNLKDINSELIRYHKSHDIGEIKAQNRRIWQDFLTMKGFYTAEYQLFMDRNV